MVIYPLDPADARSGKLPFVQCVASRSLGYQSTVLSLRISHRAPDDELFLRVVGLDGDCGFPFGRT